MLEVGDVAERCDRVLSEIERAVVGKREALELVLLGFLADGHILLEDFPGLAKTLIALLEAMQERQVTIEGVSHPLERPFLVIATQNPIEYEGTYPLPEAQLDRFLLRVGVGYPAREAEWGMLERRIERAQDEIELAPVVDRAGLLELQKAVERVHVSEAVGYYLVDL